MKRVWTVVGGVVALLVVAGVVFVACRPGSEPGPRPTGGGATPTQDAAASMTTEEFEAAVFDGDVGSSEVIGTVEGELTDGSRQVPARVDVTEVLADDNGTLVRFTLVSPSGEKSSIGLPVFNQRAVLARDIRDVAMVDPVASQRYEPYIGVGGPDGKDVLCACSTAPLDFSVGVPLTATFPALDPGTTTVTFEVPWLGPVEDLPVTRR